MTAFAANLPLLQEIVDRAASLERVLAEHVESLDARARQVRAAWSGLAAEEYAAAHASWSTGARELHTALSSLRQVVTTAHDNYGQAVSANRAMWP